MKIIKKIQKIISFLSIIKTQSYRSEKDLRFIGRNFWWLAIICDFLINLFSALVSIVFFYIFNSGLISAITYISIDQIIHGFQKIDGFCDLSEGIFYSFSNPNCNQNKVWDVVRSSQKGVYGITLIGLFLILEFSFINNLFIIFGVNAFFLIIVVNPISKISIAVALSNHKSFREKSDFRFFSEEIGKKHRIILSILIVFVISYLILYYSKIPNLNYGFFFLILILVSIFIGFSSKHYLIQKMGELNGDIIGFSWTLSELFLFFTINVYLVV
ncbi:adenosylcobinamide-GDP ribazoletransferase [Candidatus Harpocratesius sp.]